MTPPLEPDDEAYRPRLIRSYTLTAGRTATNIDLAMEATLRLQAGAGLAGGHADVAHHPRRGGIE